MAISKIVYKEDANATPVVWMDTTDKTADSGNMLNGITALKNDGTTATGNIQSQAAQTLYPSTSDQTITSGKYLTGTQTFKGVLLTNLSAGNIKKDVVVKVGDSADDDRITSVTGTYEGGGGGVTPAEQKDVNFIDYDGTILYSYTKAEFANLSALPANPSHTGLTAQGWNWTKQEITTQLAAMPDDPVFVGQMYITSDGKTRLYIHLEEGRLSPYLGIAVNGTATVEWGDNSSNSTVTGTSTSTVVNTQHNYSAAGDYVIAISVSGSMAFVGSSSYFSQVLWKNSTTANQNRVYQNTIQKVEIGADTSIGTYAFHNCNSLASITIPSGVTSIGTYAFYNCYSLASITIPNGVTSIGTYAFYYCYSLASITIPSGVTSIDDYAFGYCNSLASITIPSGVTSIDTYAFYYCYSLANITLPSGVTSISTNTFRSCYSLASITIPSGVTSISDNAFQYCYGLANIAIPSGVTSIGASAFNNCYGLGELHFTRNTPPTVSNSNTWTNIPTDCIIYVPYSANHSVLAAYTSANNYPSSSTYTYMEE